MEGPSLVLAQKQLKPFKKKRVLAVSGNTKQDKDRLLYQEVKDIFSWGKHLVFQFDDFAIRIHFLLFGTFEAEVDGVWVTGDYRRAREPRLALVFENGRINMYSCSVQFVESKRAKRNYDFSIDTMSPQWDTSAAIKRIKASGDEDIADVLLDQKIFAGVGNIIKNEVLSRRRIHPQTKAKRISTPALKDLIAETLKFCRQFYRWRAKFMLKKNLKAYGRSACPHCAGKMRRTRTGKWQRLSHWCPACQIPAR